MLKRIEPSYCMETQSAAFVVVGTLTYKGRLLGHERDTLPKTTHVQRSQILTVDFDRAAYRVVEPLHQLDDGRLATTGRPDQSDEGPRLHFQVQTPQHADSWS